MKRNNRKSVIGKCNTATESLNTSDVISLAHDVIYNADDDFESSFIENNNKRKHDSGSVSPKLLTNDYDEEIPIIKKPRILSKTTGTDKSKNDQSVTL